MNKNLNKLNKVMSNVVFAGMPTTDIKKKETKKIVEKNLKAVKKSAVKKEKKEKKLTIKALVFNLLPKPGITLQDISQAVHKAFPDSKFNKEHYYWYAQRAKDIGIKIPVTQIKSKPVKKTSKAS